MHKSFQDGLHVVRRSDRYWSGLSTYLVIEQVLMRSLKTSGGLTRGRGMTEAQRLAWVMSMPACAEVNSAMQNPTDIVNNTSEQHKEGTKARQERGHKDAHEIVTFLSLRNRFRADPSLRSITTGIVAEDNVNADKAKEVGEKILSSLTGKNVYALLSKKRSSSYNDLKSSCEVWTLSYCSRDLVLLPLEDSSRISHCLSTRCAATRLPYSIRLYSPGKRTNQP